MRSSTLKIVVKNPFAKILNTGYQIAFYDIMILSSSTCRWKTRSMYMFSCSDFTRELQLGKKMWYLIVNVIAWHCDLCIYYNT